MSDIDNLFDTYEQRKKDTRSAHEQREAHEQETQQQTAHTIKTSIVPVLTELSAFIQQRGYTFSFTEGINIYDVRFEPRIDDPAKIAVPSILHITVSGTQVSLKQEIRGNQGSSTLGIVKNGSTEDVTIEWMRAQILAFLERVLRIN